ncbi:MAG TPA: ferritin-like domain-containing protein [Gemmatimonadaceae bacterium]|nr:ferritin-like domain-containing protein [Gemmatimonadaceae bacterium]
MALESLQDLYLEQLKDLYSAETQILEALPKMIEAAGSEELRAAFETHLAQTEQQKKRLEEIGRRSGQTLTGHKCKGMEGLLEEGEELLEERADSDVLDAALIAAAQRVEHYEMAGYGCARTYARLLGLEDDANLLQQTLNEEGDTDHLLTQMAERVINIEALMGEATGDREIARSTSSEMGKGGKSSGRGRSSTTDSETRA